MISKLISTILVIAVLILLAFSTFFLLVMWRRDERGKFQEESSGESVEGLEPTLTPEAGEEPTALTNNSKMFHFYLPWDDGENTAVSLSNMLDKPTGRLGHVYIGDDGHFYVNGSRIKFLGVNICGGAAFPEKKDAEKIASRLAKFGVNLVRFHHMDADWEPFNIFDRSFKDTRHLNEKALDRLDYFIAKLKENGIYIDLNLLVSRRFRSGDGLPAEVEAVEWKDQQALGFFIEEIENLEKEYARQLLTHRNPYTGMTYCEDPAIAFIEIVNEQGLIHSWLGGVIDKLPKVFQERLRIKWNSYLLSKYGSDEEFFKAWGKAESVNQTEVLKNGCFEQGLRYWVVEVHNGAKASYEVVEGPNGMKALKIEVLELGSANWHVQFNQPGLKVKEGEIYLISFKARAERETRVSVSFAQAHSPWKTLSQRIEIVLTPEWKDYDLALQISESDDNARFDISGLSTVKTTYQFSCFSAKLSEGYGALSNESVEKMTVQILTLSDFWKRSSTARRDWVEFLYGLEERFFTEIYRYIKEELKARALVIGTIVGCSTPNIMSKLDVVDTHSYWAHPIFPMNPWDPANWYIVNEPMVNNPQQSTIVGLAVKKVAGKPHIVSEYNHPAPNMYDAETALIVATYAALQDWDGIFLFAYGSLNNWNSKKIRGHFDIDQHPVKMVTLIPAHLIFLRGDVSPAKNLVTANLRVQDEISLIAGGKVYAWGLPDAGHTGLDPLVSLVHRIAIVREGCEANSSKVRTQGPIYRSDNGEVTWDISDPKKGLITVNTSKTIAVIGFGGGRRFNFGHAIIEIGNTVLDGWCIVTLSTLDNKSFSFSSRALLVATGYTTNTRMMLRKYGEDKEMLLKWSGKNLTDVIVYNGPVTCGSNWGSAPTLVEGIPVKIKMKTDADIEVWSLDNVGNRTRKVPVFHNGDSVIFVVGPEFETIWYEIVFRRD
ncbi:MAG: carbohydrate binding domain-containing protein [Thermoproteota archaeon]